MRHKGRSVVPTLAALYAEGMARGLFGLMFGTALLIASETIPKFEDFRVSAQWSGPNATVKLVRRDERMFYTQLSRGGTERPNLAGHYRFVEWGCGSLCSAGAVVDLQTGDVYPPPKPAGAMNTGWERWIFAGGIVDGSYIEMRPDSRLVIVRQQSKAPASQEARYYEWTGTGFHLLTSRAEKIRNIGSPGK
jgi:hypothetical protein